MNICTCIHIFTFSDAVPTTIDLLINSRLYVLNSHFGGWSDDLKVFVICTFTPNISSYLFRSWKSPITYDQFESEFCGWFRCGHCAGHCSSGWVQYARACGSLRRQLTLKCWQWWCPYHDSIIGHRVFPTATTKSMRQESHPRHKETTKD